MTTKVVRVNSAEWKEAVAAGTAVYIGRANTRHNLDGGEWANPFKIGQDGNRQEVIAKFEASLRRWATRGAGRLYFRKDMLDLRGKVLGCWCAPQACHGDVLAKLADMTDEEFKEWLNG